MKRYINTSITGSGHGVETVDEVDSDDFPTLKAFRNEIKRLLKEYRLAYGSSARGVWSSQKSTEAWQER